MWEMNYGYSGFRVNYCRPQKYPDEVGGNIPSNVPVMYPIPGKMGENGGNSGGNGRKWGEVGCYGGRWGQITKSVGLGWTGLVSPFFPHFIFPHFPPFFLGSFHQCTPTIALVPIKTMFSALSSPKFPIFPSSIQNSPHFPPFPPIFSKSAHFG